MNWFNNNLFIFTSFALDSRFYRQSFLNFLLCSYLNFDVKFKD